VFLASIVTSFRHFDWFIHFEWA